MKLTNNIRFLMDPYPSVAAAVSWLNLLTQKDVAWGMNKRGKDERRYAVPKATWNGVSAGVRKHKVESET